MESTVVIKQYKPKYCQNYWSKPINISLLVHFGRNHKNTSGQKKLTPTVIIIQPDQRLQQCVVSYQGALLRHQQCQRSERFTLGSCEHISVLNRGRVGPGHDVGRCRPAVCIVLCQHTICPRGLPVAAVHNSFVTRRCSAHLKWSGSWLLSQNRHYLWRRL